MFIVSLENVVLILLRPGKNEKVFDLLFTDRSEYSGIRLGQDDEERAVVHLLQWEGKLVDSELNKKNLELLKRLVDKTSPQVSSVISSSINW